MRHGLPTPFLLAICAIGAQCRNLGENVTTTPTPTTTPVPIVTWHGVNDNANSCNGMIDEIKKTIPDVHVLNVMIGEDMTEDEYNSILMHSNDQVALVCDMIKNDPKLASGYNGIAYSQGGQFMRGVAQRCPDPPMKNLITMGSQHQGVYGIPHCPGESDALCEFVRAVISLGAYTPWLQDLVTAAQYWHDPLNHTAYVHGSHYLAEINNEGEEKNPDYKTNLENLENFVMVKWRSETTVEPMESSHFEFYIAGSENEILPLRESDIYKDDWIGLKTLDESGRLHFLVSEGDHMHLDRPWFTENIVKVFLA